MSEQIDFTMINTLSCWEASDHYVVQMSNPQTHLNSPFTFRLTSKRIKLLCKIFGIKYDPEWTCTMNQITIRK